MFLVLPRGALCGSLYNCVREVQVFDVFFGILGIFFRKFYAVLQIDIAWRSDLNGSLDGMNSWAM